MWMWFGDLYDKCGNYYDYRCKESVHDFPSFPYLGPYYADGRVRLLPELSQLFCCGQDPLRCVPHRHECCAHESGPGSRSLRH
jgi:hypothetical protein